MLVAGLLLSLFTLPLLVSVLCLDAKAVTLADEQVPVAILDAAVRLLTVLALAVALL